MGEQIYATKEVHRPPVTRGKVSPVLSQGLPATLLSSEEVRAHTSLGKSDAQQRLGRGGQLICLKILQS